MPQNFFRKNASFFITAFVILSLLGIALIIWPKPELFLALNNYHHTVLDYLFRVLTVLGDGWFVIALAIALFFARKRALSLLILSSYLLSGLAVQLIKNWFPDPRPALYLRLHQIDYGNFLEGITLHNYYSFPSGHTTSAFALSASIAFVSVNKKWGPFLAIAALFVGYSRVYLGQHFPEDVIAGMSLGIGCCVLCYAVFGKVFFRWEKKWNHAP